MGIVRRQDPKFPAKLKEIVPEIKALYYRGKWRNWDEEVVIAVVGARKISEFGRKAVESIVQELVKAQCWVVSGYMYGVDIETHRKVIVEGGKTMAILGHGIEYPLDPYYDSLSYKLLERDGLFVSEWKDYPPRPFTYLQRNRIVAGIADAVIVVEAGAKSGSLHTAEWALKLRKKLFAVPGPITSPVSIGTNRLIADGKAEMLTIDSLRNYLEKKGKKIYSQKGLKDEAKFRGNIKEKKIVTLLQREGSLALNELTRLSGLRTEDILAILTSLDMKGAVSSKSGKWVSCESN